VAILASHLCVNFSVVGTIRKGYLVDEVFALPGSRSLPNELLEAANDALEETLGVGGALLFRLTLLGLLKLRLHVDIEQVALIFDVDERLLLRCCCLIILRVILNHDWLG